MNVLENSSNNLKLVAENVSVEYAVGKQSKDRLLALKDITFGIREGEFFCIVGPSGCGKSTFLHTVAGLVPYNGMVNLDGRPIKGPGRDRGVVFQHASLLPWRNALDNVVYGLELQGKRRDQARQKGLALLNLVGLTGFERTFPKQLSGGMQQRCNLARALATEPSLLLLDEPFAALDAQTREFMQEELLRIWQDLGMTALMVTHQIDEAIYLADRVAVMTSRPGRIREFVEIKLPRPRALDIKRDPAFISYVNHIWRLIESEAREAVPRS